MGSGGSNCLPSGMRGKVTELKDMLSGRDLLVSRIGAATGEAFGESL